MTKNFWQKILQKRGQILALSPMDGVSDEVFRILTKKYGRPDVVYTEFASVEGLCHQAKIILRHFDFIPIEQPVVAQVFGKTPSHFYQVAILLCELGVAGIDVNMGCPAHSVATHGSGAALIKNPALAQEILRQIQTAIQDWQNGQTLENCVDISSEIVNEVRQRQVRFCSQQSLVSLSSSRCVPTLSVKTRLGFDSNELETWLPKLLVLQPAAIAIHTRSFKQAYRGQADWSALAVARKLRDELAPQTLLLGNGDLKNADEATEKIKCWQLDGALIGRASIGNPYVFLPLADRQKAQTTLPLISLAIEHAQLYEELYSKQEKYTFLPMRKYLAAYTKGLMQAKELRLALMQSQNASEVAKLITAFRSNE